MSEIISEYGGDRTTFTKLAKYVLSTFCFPKIIRDSHKPDPLTEDLYYLKKRADEERDERSKAFIIWETNRTERNANKVLEEIADEINILLFMAGEIAGYKSMERR